ncbi:MAG: GNAT family N-acetyltransferase [Melioribacteraceae bacterium]
MKTTIDYLQLSSEHFKSVLALHKANSKTLGFLPEGAFKKATDENKIIITFDNNKLLGYLLYNVNKRGNFLYIVHFCILKESRRKGIAKKLFNFFIAETSKKYRGIRVSCREEYEASKVWEKLGFVCEFEKAGKKRTGSRLFIWWYDFNHPDLFTIKQENKKTRVVLDSNIVIDLMNKVSQRNMSSHALLSDWLAEDVEYCYTEQLKNDISHQKDLSLRQATSEFITQFKLLKNNTDSLQKTVTEIKSIYNKRLTLREESDIRHLARTIHTEANYFLTKDEGILKRADILLERYSLLIMRPEEFLIRISSLINEVDYYPSRFSGANLLINTPSIVELRAITEAFFESTIEKKREFYYKIHSTLLNKNSRPFLIKEKNENIAFYVIDNSSEVFEVKFLRYIKNYRNITVVNQILFNFISDALRSNNKIIKISEGFINNDIESTLKSYGFLKVDGSFYKYISNDIIEYSTIRAYLEKKLNNTNLLAEYKKILQSDSAFELSPKFFIEKFFFPLKFRQTEIPCFIIPIRPQWAMNLFHLRLSSDDLFGGKQELLFNKENAYYRSAKQKTLTNQCRILWYISKGKFSDTMSISASAYVNEVEIDKPKILFKKYKRLGVYTWDNIFDTAHGDVNNEIMAFSFELTENFLTPIGFEQLNQLYNKHLKRNFFAPMIPTKIPENLFFEIYKLGQHKGSSYES